MHIIIRGKLKEKKIIKQKQEKLHLSTYEI